MYELKRLHNLGLEEDNPDALESLKSEVSWAGFSSRFQKNPR
jgi:hypothetical protein